jgi:integrase/recombinase XerD
VTIGDAIGQYLRALSARRYARRTIETYEDHLAAFEAWLTGRGIERSADVTIEILREYQAELTSRITRYDRPLSLRAQASRLGVIKGLFAFLVRRGFLLVDPARELELPRRDRRSLPYGLPTPREMARILAAPDTTRPAGIRDRAILEVLYSSAIRNAELRALRVWDVDLTEGLLTVVKGKGGKDRVVPLGREACRWVGGYLARVRPRYVRKRTTSVLFLTRGGRPMDFSYLNRMVKEQARRAGVSRRLTVHTFRHACATHMLQAGAGIRHLQRLLGHRSLLSTEVYTHLEIRDLKRVHRKCHPRARR